MRNILLLARTGFFNAWGASTKRKKRARAFKGSVFLVSSLLIMVVIGFYANLMADLFEHIGAPETLVTLGSAIGILTAIMLGIAKTPATLFAAKDIEQLLSMPIGVIQIFLSKLAIVYSFSFTGYVGIALPFSAVYAIRFGADAFFFVALALSFLLMPLLLCAVSSIIGLAISAVARRFRSTNAAMMVLSIAFFALYFGFFFSLSGRSDGQMAAMFMGIGGWLADFLPTGLVLRATMGDALSLLYMAALCAVPIALFAVIFSRSFRKINLALREKHMRGGFSAASIEKTSSAKAPFSALVSRELKMYFSRYFYVLNTAVGAVMLAAFTVMVALGLGSFKEFAAMGNGLLVPLYTAVACFAATLSPTTASTISLEGGSLWVLKSLPVSETSIFRAKLAVQLVITLPVIFVCGAIMAITQSLGFVDSLIILIVPTALSFFGGVLGLAANVRFPMMEWKNPIVPVKRGTAVAICIFGTIAFILIAVVLYIWLKLPFALFATIITVLAVLSTTVLWNWLTRAGKRRFKNI